MSAKHFCGNQELFSLNMGVSERTMFLAHSAPSPSKPSQEEVAYNKYAAYCRSIGSDPLSFEDWYLKDEKLNLADLRAFLRVHGGDFTHMYGHKESPFSFGRSGSWDNAVRVLENQ